MTGNELDELRELTDPGSRVKQPAKEDDVDELETAIVEALEAINQRGKAKTLSVRDERLAAVIYGLEATGEIETVGASLQSALGRDVDDSVDRSELLRLALRVGLQEAAPEVIETAKSAQIRHMTDQF
ncbi:hypothetical protein [Halomarina ordinaria]|uniref:DUF8115 domain-containing protein n=1 Tax=Halomarina ordinaria TaxID=3033939 RepID=A0ABD5UDU3_9EURY|nr:hypothetical protein [Halomarina sp. PSRA2]